MHKHLFLILFGTAFLSGADNQKVSFETIFDVLTNPADGYFYKREPRLRGRHIWNSDKTKIERVEFVKVEVTLLKDGVTEEDVEAHKKQFLCSLPESSALALLRVNKAINKSWGLYVQDHRAKQIAKYESSNAIYIYTLSGTKRPPRGNAR